MKGNNNRIEMPSDLESWASYLAEKALPLMETTTQYVNHLDNRSGRSVESICANLLLDPGAVVCLLQQVNSLKRGRLSSEITTVENAIVLLGIDKSRQLLKRRKIVKLPVKAPALKQYIKQIDLAYHAGYLAYEWAIIRGSMTPKESFIQAFLFRIGEMYMWLYGLSEIVKVRDVAISKKIPFRVAQKEIMGFDFRQLSAKMSGILNMPEIVQVCHDQDNLEIPNVKAVHLASSWVSLASQTGLYTLAIRSCEEKIAELLDYSLDRTISMLHKTIVDIAKETVVYKILPLARELPRTDVELPKITGASVNTPSKEDVRLPPKPSAIIQSKRKSVSVASSYEPLKGSGQSDSYLNYDPVNDEHSASEVLVELIGLLNQGKLNKLSHQNLVSLFLGKMKKALDLDHVLHCETGSKGKSLKAIQFSDKQTRARLGKFWVDISRDNIISRLLKKSQSLWLSDKNREKLWPLLPVVVKGLINTKSFFMITLILKNGLSCLIYADRASGNIELDDKTYQLFKKLCKLFGDNLELLES